MTPLIDFCRIARPPARPRHGRLWGEVFPWALNYLATRALREVTQGEAPWLARAPQRVASRLARILRKGL
jgi:hypothetical protein